MVISCVSLRELLSFGRAETAGERGGISLGIPQLSYVFFFSPTAYGWDPLLLLKLLHVLLCSARGLCRWLLCPGASLLSALGPCSPAFPGAVVWGREYPWQMLPSSGHCVSVLTDYQ